jgi:(2Fe-2S) ferredoxin
MTRFERHVFVCENQRTPDDPRGSCKAKGSTELRLAMKTIIDQAGAKSRIRCNMAGCLDACAYGPSVVVYPDAVWYTVPTPADAEEIAREHLLGGRIVERLRMKVRDTK